MTRPTTRASRGEPCDAGHCKERSTIDFGRHISAIGIPGLVRYLCCWHMRGLTGHLMTTHECTLDTTSQGAQQ